MNQHSPRNAPDEPDGSDGSGGSGGADPGTTARLTTVFSAIADDRRRAILRAVRGPEAGELPLEDLVVAVDEAVHSGDGAEFDEQRRRRVRTALHHNHLPKLEESGFIEYDSDSGTVRMARDEFRSEVVELIGLQDGPD